MSTLRPKLNQEDIMTRIRINWGEAIVPILTLLFGVAFLLQTLDAPNVAIFWPAVIGTLTCALWLGVVVKFVLLKEKISKNGKKVDAKKIFNDFKRPGLILFGSFGYLFALPWLGFTLSNLVFMLIIFRGLGGTKWLNNVLIALGIAIFLHISLIVIMQLSLPQLDLYVFTL